MSDLEARAVRVGEACDEAWAKAHADTRLNTPLGVVAALSLLSQGDADQTTQLLGLDPDNLLSALREIWKQFTNARPDMVTPAFPLIGWLFEEIPDKVKAGAWDVAQAALRNGIIHLTGTDSRYEVDVLGIVWTMMQPVSSRKVDAKYYTPGPLGELMARMVGLPEPGESVGEPACGTGGNFRAMAWQMRLAERDPASVIWVGIDIDDLAIACCAVSAVSWGLGPNVVLAVGDVLRDPQEPVDRAITMRQEALELAERARGVNAVVGAVRQAETLLSAVGGGE